MALIYSLQIKMSTSQMTSYLQCVTSSTHAHIRARMFFTAAYFLYIYVMFWDETHTSQTLNFLCSSEGWPWTSNPPLHPQRSRITGLQHPARFMRHWRTGHKDFIRSQQAVYPKKDTLSLTFVLEYLIVKRISTDSPIAHNINNIS